MKKTNMVSVIRSPKDFSLGIIYLAAGASGFWMARELPFGSGARMGAGYFPTIISSLLFLFGLVSVIRGFVLGGGRPIEVIAWKTLPLIVGSVLAFAVLIDDVGLLIAGLVLLLLCAVASVRFRFSWVALLGAITLVVTCKLLFIDGLGVPMPAVGPWLTGILPTAPAQ
jgi:hypothetical protein